MALATWKSIPCVITELSLKHTLKCGQSFRWNEIHPGIWIGVIGKQVFQLKQDATCLYYQVLHQQSPDLGPDSTSQVNHDVDVKDESEINDAKITRSSPVDFKLEGDETVKTQCVSSDAVSQSGHNDISKRLSRTSSLDENETIIKDYFQLNVNLGKLYKSWSKADSNFKEVSSTFQGIRMLRQDPVENLFSFICSSNNHISRISAMVEKLCDNYGRKIGDVEGKMYHAFPEVSSLAVDGVEERLRELGFGYRAKYISLTANYIIKNHGEDWLYSLRSRPYEETKRELMKLSGVGAKVADCVCLMSMDKPGSIPVDTHVWQIAQRHYMPHLRQSKSLTDKLYDEIGNNFRSQWGEYAGWAHSVLFAADLKHFQEPKSIKDKSSQTKMPKKRQAGKKSRGGVNKQARKK